MCYMVAEKDGYKLNIHVDLDPYNCRNNDNLGAMICFHRRYELGDPDKHDLSSDDFNSWEEMRTYLEKEMDACIILPLYLYEHSGITMSTGPFSCQWDSGQVGFIYISKEKIRKEYNAKRISKKLKARVEEYLENEVEEYDLYIRGEVYGYTLEKEVDGSFQEIDSCWGFYSSNWTENGILDNIGKEYKYLVEALK